MKRLLIVCITLLIATASSLAAEVDIKLNKKDEAGTRSLPIEPTATHDGNKIYIYYSGYIMLENLQITVTHSSGEVVYSNIISLSYNQPYSFILDNAENGEYKIELAYGSKLLYGSLDIK